MSAIAVPFRSRVRLSFTGVLASELIKLRSLRSIRLAFLSIVLLCGLGMVTAAGNYVADLGAGPLGASGAAWRVVVQAGEFGGDLGVLVFAALVGGTEFTTRSVITSFVAAPRRLAVLLAKLVVTVGAVVVASGIGTALGIVASIPVMRAAHFAPVTSDVVGYCLANLVEFALIAAVLLPVAVLTRSTAAAVAFGFVAVFVMQLLVSHLSQLVGLDLYGTLLTSAADGAASPLHAPGLTSVFWRELTAAVIWAVVPWFAACFSTVRRDV